MVSLRRLRRGFDLFLPRHRPTVEEDLFRLRFAAAVCWIAIAVALTTVVICFHMLPHTALLSGVAGAAMLAVGIGLKAGLPARAGFWLSACLVAALYAFLPLGEDHLDYALVVWITTIPVSAMLFDGIWGGLIGLALALAAFAGMSWSSTVAFVDRDAVSETISVLRVVLLLLTMFGLAATFEVLRADAVRRALEAARARTYFLASMSHEIRTPMNGVIGLVEILLEDLHEPEQRRQLELIQRSGQQLVSLIDDIIDFSRLEHERARISLRPTSVREVISDCHTLAAAIPRRGFIVVHSDVSPEVPTWIQLDPVRLRQIVMNLASNAVKFTESGEVVLRAETRDGKLVISVSDTGIGIPTEALARLFQPFEQVHEGYRSRGSGLGLAITRRLVERLGGTISVTSTVAQGSTFTVVLPLTVVAAPEAASPATRNGSRPNGPREVLIVDDNEVNRYVTAAMVTRIGFEPRLAESGAQAVDAVAQRHFAFVLMDCCMPGMDGYEATRRIRALHEPACHTPVIALSASVMPEDREACLAAGMNAFAGKPLTAETLDAAIADAKSSHRQALQAEHATAHGASAKLP